LVDEHGDEHCERGEEREGNRMAPSTPEERSDHPVTVATRAVREDNLAGEAVETSPVASEQRLDELYREHPEGFVAGRDRLVKDLRSAGDRDEADRVKRLRRPTAAAWLINRAALTSPARVRQFAEVSRQLEDAQGRALEGNEDGAAAWRAAAAHEREAAAAVVDVAERAAREAGHPPTERVLEQVGETLRAAAADPELRERVLSGRVERERSAATLGTPAAGPLPRRGGKSAKRGDRAQARRELERLEGELADAEAREERLRAQVDRTSDALREEKAKLADSKREKGVLKRRVKAAERRARG
jgi:hypothetical protein